MARIGVLSDTHGYWDDRFRIYLNACDEIWHAGDIGSEEVAEKLEALGKPFRAVFGNIDSYQLRVTYPQYQNFHLEGVHILMTHIGGYPGKYNRQLIPLLQKERPNLLIAGHSHILKVAYDRQWKMLYINPGAAGKYGVQPKQTLIRFTIEEGAFKDLEVVELA